MSVGIGRLESAGGKQGERNPKLWGLYSTVPQLLRRRRSWVIMRLSPRVKSDRLLTMILTIQNSTRRFTCDAASSRTSEIAPIANHPYYQGAGGIRVSGLRFLFDVDFPRSLIEIIEQRRAEPSFHFEVR